MSSWCFSSIDKADRALVLERRDSSRLGVTVTNKYDPSDGVAFKLTVVHSESQEQFSCEVSKEGASAGGCKPLSLVPGVYRVTVEPLPPPGQSIGPKGLDDSFSQIVNVAPASSRQVPFQITRKQSVLHNIPMRFRVAPNPDADGGEPLRELDCMSQVAEHRLLIEDKAKHAGIDSDLVKAIVYMETTHGYYDKPLALIDMNTSVLPMNIRTEYWKDLGWTRKELKVPENNIEAGVFLLRRISDRVDPKSVETVATLYQDLGAEKITDYGARVGQIYRDKLWIPTPSMFEQIQQSIAAFDRMSPLEQLNLLNRIFGGPPLELPY